ncbi:DUF6415 family natural product biosynthesis protein [Streptomyces sp. NPDC044571]|uniref:DUF6415 family natural product biosynthesis protein n=1 Tax=Streptomyces sp. NPDC044571 TaxID=3155371 RepID=UPI0033EAD813
MHESPADTPASAMAADAAALVSKALVPYNLKPPDEDIAALLSGLTIQGEQLLCDVIRRNGAAAAGNALEDWRTLTGRGPEASPLGDWNRVRALARVVRAFHRVITQEG